MDIAWVEYLNQASGAARQRDYLARLGPTESPAARQLRRDGRYLTGGHMQSGPLVGQLLKFLVRLSGSIQILDAGTFTGYSALVLAEALAGGSRSQRETGRVWTVDTNARTQRIARFGWSRADLVVAGKIIPVTVRLAHFLENKTRGARDIPEQFDFIFLDTDKKSYPDILPVVLERLAPGGLLVADNCLPQNEDLFPPRVSGAGAGAGGGDGKGAVPIEAGEIWPGQAPYVEKRGTKARGRAAGEAIERFNELVAGHPELESMLLPLRDGVMVARKAPNPESG